MVSIRKAHGALHGALVANRGTIRDLVAPAYARICQLGEPACDLAERADDVRVRREAPAAPARDRTRHGQFLAMPKLLASAALAGHPRWGAR